MLRIYRTEEDGRLTKLKKNKILPMTWCSLVNPNEEELLQVSTVLHVDYDLLSNSLDADERSRIEQEKIRWPSSSTCRFWTTRAILTLSPAAWSSPQKLHHHLRPRQPRYEFF